MKLTWKQIEPFVKNPDPKARVVLIYGPDTGLARERCRAIGQSVVSDLTDPFNVALLDDAACAGDPGLIEAEANAISMMGGARLIWIKGASDRLVPALTAYLENPNTENLVLLEAGDLGPTSKLRKLCEKDKAAAALPCYVEDARGLTQFIRTYMGDHDKSVPPDAVAWLADALAGDRLKVRMELDKLITYAGPERNITLTDCMDVCGEAGAGSLDDLIYATAGGDTAAALKALSRLSGDGTAPIVTLRALQNHYRRLHLVRAAMDSGEDADTSLKRLQPPLFFKVADSFKGQVRRYSSDKLLNILARLAALEAQTKTTGAPAETLTAQAILSLSAAA